MPSETSVIKCLMVKNLTEDFAATREPHPDLAISMNQSLSECCNCTRIDVASPRDSRADDSLISRPVIGRRNQNRQAAAVHLLSGRAKT
jgi:hypothetical protein